MPIVGSHFDICDDHEERIRDLTDRVTRMEERSKTDAKWIGIVAGIIAAIPGIVSLFLKTVTK